MEKLVLTGFVNTRRNHGPGLGGVGISCSTERLKHFLFPEREYNGAPKDYIRQGLDEDQFRVLGVFGPQELEAFVAIASNEAKKATLDAALAGGVDRHALKTSLGFGVGDDDECFRRVGIGGCMQHA